MTKAPARGSPWVWAACGIAAGTLGNVAFEAVFRCVLFAAIRATSPVEPESPAMYATWPIYARTLANTLQPLSLVQGATAGLALALVLSRMKAFRVSQALICAVTVAVLFLAVRFSRFPASPGIFKAVWIDVLRGATLGWLAWHLHARWETK